MFVFRVERYDLSHTRAKPYLKKYCCIISRNGENKNSTTNHKQISPETI